jgi:hypothetical protein
MGKNTMDLEYFIVAFIDILGFSQMVRDDCENKNGKKHFDELRVSYLSIRDKYRDYADIKQFSDSIIVSLPLNMENFNKIIEISRNIQKELFMRRILARGGISFGRHYTESDFIFSEGLINAYILEKDNAKNPRILISKDLFELFLNTEQLLNEGKILKEDDNKYFVHYINLISAKECENIFVDLSKIDKNDYSIREKYRWIYEYAKYYFQDELKIGMSRFIASIFD